MPNDKMLKTLYAATLILSGSDRQAEVHIKEAQKLKEEYLISENSLTDDLLHKRVDKEGLRAFFLYVDETRESVMKKKEALENAIKRCPNFRSGLFQLAICWLQLQRPQEAIKVLEELSLQDPNDITCAYYLAELYYQRYNMPSAWKAYNKAEKLARAKGKIPQALVNLKTIFSIRDPS